ncbi:MAG: BTAD domain-containing putative transcriptional regulator [Actinophytocola sp.]|uniref:AfsR/SARP family transcriptional regulator n=1 Tax=Actinophytocola sp. TaxID=1872138 RepID=UPI003D6B273C
MADHDGSRAAATAAGLRFCLLGPVQVLAHGRDVPLGGTGMRGVLAMLLLEPNQVVPLDRIVDVLWAHEPPASARTMVQGYVSRLRQRLAEAAAGVDVRIATAPPGYRLEVDEALIDVTIARSLLSETRGTSAVRRAELLRQAQALWRGTALADLGGRLTAPELTELRLAVLEARIDADLELGRHHEIIGELTSLVVEQPFRERLVGQLMLALYRSGRRATALAAYQRLAHRAADELGMDPGPQLRGLHLRVLRDDTTLLEPSPEPVIAPRIGVLVPAQLPRAPSGFAGREDELAWLTRLLPTDKTPTDTTPVEPAIAVLAGPAGMGKTALAVLWAHRVADRFPDGQLFASLRGFDPQHAPASAGDVLTRFLLALGVGVEDVPVEVDERAALYRSILADRRVLVVLDDARDSEQIRPLLPAASASLVVVTTRVRLDALVAWTGARMQVLGTLAAGAAEALLEHMAGTPAQGRDRELRRKLARLCGHLPLALRIAGARLTGGPQWTIADLVEELADERGRLSALDLEEADTSVRAALDVTYRGLRPELAETVRLLGLFPGTMIGPYPVAALCGVEVDQARRRLRTLAGSFVVTETSRDVFLMHDLVRLHAHELAEQELSDVDKVAARARLRRYYLVGADLAKSQLRSGVSDEPRVSEEFPDAPRVPISSPADAVDWIDQEWANLLAVVESGLETGQDQEIVRLARMASEFSEGTRALGPVVIGRTVRLVV